jgi:plastocyanin
MDSPLANSPARIAAGLVLALTLTVLVMGAPVKAVVAPVTVTLDLSRTTKIVHLDAGDAVGVTPARIVVRVGQSIVFVNSDSRHHTATSLGDEQTFPESPRWTESALRASGTIGSGAWSTGDLAPGARSLPIEAAKPGTYLFGCFFDYSAGMRGEIIVEQ